MISNSGHDENGKYHGGVAGDQSKTEWAVIGWYNRPWTVVLRYPDPAVAYTIAENTYKAAMNDNIGYNQYKRTSFWTQLQAASYDPSKIVNKCDADCTAGVTACVKATGYKYNIAKLKSLSKDIYSGNMKEAFKKAGFQVLTASKYLTSDDYLLPGDILLYENHHAATNLTTGKKAQANTTNTDTTDYPTWIQAGSTWYYRIAPGQNAHGWYKIKEVWYYFDNNGVMQTGWITDEGKMYYLGNSGAMAANTWVKTGNDWYYVGSDGAAYTNRWLQYKGEWYYLGADGKMLANQWIKYKGQWYYLKSDGAMAKNCYIKDSKGRGYCWLDSNGVWNENYVQTVEIKPLS